jgi:CubicO group peptidase (beta-lactamase class C family)
MNDSHQGAIKEKLPPFWQSRIGVNHAMIRNPRIALLLIAFLLPAVVQSDSDTADDKAEKNLANELALIENWLAGQRAYDRVPALSAAIVHDQELLWSGASGYADIERKEPAATDTIYGICSISKLFTGIAVMQLRDEGKVHLDDPVSDLLPWFDLEQAHAGSPEITLEGMLTHSAGLPRESEWPYWTGPDFPFPTRSEIREKLGSQSTLYPASRYFQYSNLGLTLVGEVVEHISGQPYRAYIREHILTPLGLNDTDTGFPTDTREPRIATGYSFPDRDGVLKAMPRYDARGIAPAAGFASTALDLAKFASWQFRVRAGGGDQVLSGNTLKEMQRVHWMDWDWGTSWGLAFGIYRKGERTLTGHGGSCPGFNTRIYIDPDSLYGVAVMANRNNVDVDGYAGTMLDILDAEGTLDETTESTLPNLADYVGSYDAHPWSGEDIVVQWEDGLAIVYLPTRDPLDDLVRLQHVEGDRFRTVRSDEQPGHEVIFTRDGAGRVSHLTYHSNPQPKM